MREKLPHQPHTQGYRSHYQIYLIIALLTTALPACSRGLPVESEPGPAYAIQIDNPLAEPMIIRYDAGTGSHLLGMVPAGTEGRFMISRPAREELSSTAANARGHGKTN